MMPVERETIAKILAFAGVVGIGVASAVKAKKPPAAPPPPVKVPAGAVTRMGIDTVDSTVVVKVFVVATRGATPITASITCELDGQRQTKTITITELNREYELDFSFTVTESGTYTVTASGILRNAYGQYSLPPMSATISVTVYKPFTITIRATADGKEIRVPVTGLFPKGSWETPFEIEVTSGLYGKLLTFEAPYRVILASEPYALEAVENGVLGEIIGEKRRFSVLADKPKTVVLKYRKVSYLAKWASRDAYVIVYDAWHRTEWRGSVVEVVENRVEQGYATWLTPPRRYYDWYIRVKLVSGPKPTIIAWDTSGHGVSLRWSNSEAYIRTRIWEPYSPKEIEICIDREHCIEVPPGQTGTFRVGKEVHIMGIDAEFRAGGDVVWYAVFNDPVQSDVYDGPGRLHGYRVAGLVFDIATGRVRKEWQAKSRSSIEIRAQMRWQEAPETTVITISAEKIREA